MVLYARAVNAAAGVDKTLTAHEKLSSLLFDLLTFQ